MNIRKWNWLLIFFFLLSLLSACGGGSAKYVHPEPEADEDTNITINQINTSLHGYLFIAEKTYFWT